MKLPHVLKRSREMRIDLNRYRAEELKKAARFWVGKEAGKFHKEQNISALTKVFGQKTSAKRIIPQLSDTQKRVLEIFARYGPVVSGPVLSVEVQQRGLVEKEDDSPQSYFKRRRDDVVNDLCDKLVLIRGGYNDYHSSYNRRYPELTLHPAIGAVIEPARPLTWKPSQPAGKVKASLARSSAEPALDLWRVAEALHAMGNWKTVKGDALSKGSRNKLRKIVSLPSAEDDRLAAPDPESFFYELLRELGFLSVALEPRCVLRAGLEEHFAGPAVAQAWHWLRAWLDIRLWQDGIGVVPDRYNHYEPVRIEPGSLWKAKELLIWAFCRVAHSPCDWLDLEVFLKDFWQATHEAASSFYWYGYTWNPDFAVARSKEKFPAGPDRSLAFWLDGEGVWAANVIMVTFVTLGLIERSESGGKERPCFRLTDLGRQVFGAPETEAADLQETKPFLTIQPNYEILAYLDSADARHVCTLARFARRGTTHGGRVQAFLLSRESVYEALESGMTVAEIQGFLAEQGKTEMPPNVARTLTEWSGKRESLVLRNGVTVVLATRAGELEGIGAQARMLGDVSAVLNKMSSKKAARDFPGWSVIDHQAELPRVWNVDELGGMRSCGEDTVSCMRLRCMADCTADGWLISEKSISRARKNGFTADQLLCWLSAHLSHQTPALLEMAIRNWTGRVSAFVGKVQLLQIARAEARDAILNSDVFQPFLAGHIPPSWFIVRDDTAAEMKGLLKRLGFRIDASYQVASLDASRRSETERRLPARKTRRKRR